MQESLLPRGVVGVVDLVLLQELPDLLWLVDLALSLQCCHHAALLVDLLVLHGPPADLGTSPLLQWTPSRPDAAPCYYFLIYLRSDHWPNQIQDILATNSVD